MTSQSLRICLFGEPKFSTSGGAFKFAAPPKTLPLLAYLLLHRERRANRDKVAFTLWENDAEEDARANLRRHLFHIQQALPQAPDGRPWVLAEHDSIQWNPHADAWLDVAEFERCAASPGGRTIAVELYVGDLLEALYDEWLHPERDRLKSIFISTLSGLVVEYRGRRDFSSAATSAQRILAIDPWREDTLRQLMAVRYQSGDRAGALTAYDRFSRLLRAEIDVDPMPETESLREVILRNGSLPDTPTAHAESESASARLALPFSGRESEFEQLRALWSRSARGRGGVAFVSGEAGIGKTRLVSEFALRAGAEGGRIIVGGTSMPENKPYQSFVEALRSVAALVAAMEMDPIWLSAVSQIVPDVRSRRSDLQALPAVDPAREQSRLFEALYQCFKGLSKPRPLLVILEDLHWAGAASAAALEFLASRIGPHAILLIATYREEDAARGHALRDVARRLRQGKLASSIGLGRLTLEAVERIVRESPAFADLGVDQTSAAQRLHTETEGNPLFLAEVIRDVEATREPMTVSAAGGSVRSMIAGRIERLSPDARSLADVAAVIGPGFDVEMVRDVCGWPDEHLLSPLEELIDRSIIREAAGRNRFDYVFTHHLIQSTIYDQVSAPVRQRRHHRIANVLAQAQGLEADERAADLARHFDAGGDPEQAAHWYSRAARHAYAVHANEEATELAARGVALTSEPRLAFELLGIQEAALALVGDRSAQRLVIAELMRVAVAAGDRELRDDALLRQIHLHRALGETDAERDTIDTLFRESRDSGGDRWAAIALLERGWHLVATSQYETAREDLNAAASLCAEVGDVEREAECWCALAQIEALRERVPEMQSSIDKAMAIAKNAGSHIASRLIDVKVRAAASRLDYRALRAAGLERLELARTAGDRDGEAVGHSAAANGFAGLMEVDVARGHFDAALRIYRLLGDRAGEAKVLHDSGVFDIVLCRLDDAWNALERAEELFGPARNLRGMAYCALNMSYIAYQQRDFERCRTTAARALDLAREMKNIGVEAGALINLASAESQLGDHAQAAQHAHAGLTLVRGNEQPAELAAYLAEAALIYSASGEHQSALDAARECLELYEAHGEAMRFPANAVWAVARVYRAARKSKRASDLVRTAVVVLRARAAAIPDATAREAYLAMPDHCEIVQAAERGVWPPLMRAPDRRERRR